MDVPSIDIYAYILGEEKMVEEVKKHNSWERQVEPLLPEWVSSLASLLLFFVLGIIFGLLISVIFAQPIYGAGCNATQIVMDYCGAGYAYLPSFNIS